MNNKRFAKLTAAAVIALLALTGCSSKPKQPELGADNGGLHGYWKPWSGAKSAEGEYGDDYWAATAGREMPARSHAPVPVEPMLRDSAPNLFEMP